MAMNISTRARAKTADSANASAIQRRESESPPLSNSVHMSENLPTDLNAQQGSLSADGDSGESAVVSIPAQNIRQFKEAVVNTSRLLKVFGDQEKELAKAKAEIAKFQEEFKRMQSAQQALQREADTRSRDLVKANAETDSARTLLLQREEELSRVRGVKEDLEIKISELRRAEPASSQQVAVPKSPDMSVMEELERLKRELEAKEGSLKSLRISRDSIRSSTRAEVMSIQAKYAREQMELIDRHEKEKMQHRLSLRNKEAELDAEQERLVQMEMDLNMRATQLEDQAAELKAGLDSMTAKYDASQAELRRVEEHTKTRHADGRAETARLLRAAKKDEKRIAELEAALQKATAHAKEAARENAKARARHRPKSTATAADAVSAATEDLAEMDIAELRDEVATLRIDAVHKDETIRRLEVMVAELERKQNPEGGKLRGRAAALQAEVDDLAAQLAVRDKKIDALEAALHIPATAAVDAASPDLAARIAQLDLKLISLEAAVSERDQQIVVLKRELSDAAAAASERPMRLRQPPAAARSPSVQAARHATADLPSKAASACYDQQPASNARSRSGMRGAQPQDGQGEALYAEIASLRAKVDRLLQGRAALQELVTEQQVKIRQLRNGGDTSATAPDGDVTGASQPLMTQSTAPTTHTQRKRVPPADCADEVERVGVVVPKRPKSAPVTPFELLSRNILASVSAGKASTPKQSRQAVVRQSDSSGDSATEAIERLLRDKRISSVNRTKRLLKFIQISPQNLHAALLAMPDDMPAIDFVEFFRALPPILLSLASASKPGTPASTRVLPCSAPSSALACADRLPHGLYDNEASMTMSLWVLCVKNGREAFFSDLMRMLAMLIVAPPSDIALPAVCSLARIFSAISLLATDIQRVRVLLCDIFMDAVDGLHTLPVLANTLAVWPDVLAMPPSNSPAPASAQALSLGLVIRAFQAVASGFHDVYAEARGKDEADALYSVMVDRCAWRPPCDAEFADRLLVEVGEVLQQLDQASPAYSIALCARSVLAPYAVAS